MLMLVVSINKCFIFNDSDVGGSANSNIILCLQKVMIITSTLNIDTPPPLMAKY